MAAVRRSGGGGGGRWGAQRPVASRHAARAPAMFYEDLIASVQRHPQLYVPTHRNYKSRCQRKKTWESIAVELGQGGKDAFLRKRWKHLKDKYRKELKKIRFRHNGEIPKECTSPWPMFDRLHFLRDDVLYRDSIKQENNSNLTNCPDAAMSETDHSDREMGSVDAATENFDKNETPGNYKDALGMSELFQNRPCATTDMSMMDPDLLFLVSLLPSMKSLTEVQKLQFRGKVNDLLLEAVTVNECNPQMYMQQQMQEVNEAEG